MSDGARSPGPSRKLPTARILAIAAAAGLVPLNSTMIAVALPAIADDFDVSTATVTTLITIYLIVMLVGQPLAGRLTDVIGAGRAVRFALVGLAVFSLGAALVPTFAALVTARALQAACAAALGPGAQSVLRSISDSDQQGRVFGILGSVLGTGAALGPVVGGVLVQAFGWQAIFLVNVPIAAFALFAVRAGNGATSRAADHSGEHDERILNRTFLAGFSAQALSTQAQYALLLLTPVVLSARGWEAGSIGLALSALTFGMIVMGPIGGRLGDVRGRRVPSTFGLSVAAIAIGALLIGGPSTSPAALVVWLLVFGVGLGVTTPNLMSAALGSVPPSRTGAAAGVLSMSRYVGSIGTSLLITGFVTADADGTRVVLGVSAVCMVLAILVSRMLPGDKNRDQTYDPGIAADSAR